MAKKKRNKSVLPHSQRVTPTMSATVDRDRLRTIDYALKKDACAANRSELVNSLLPSNKMIVDGLLDYMKLHELQGSIGDGLWACVFWAIKHDMIGQDAKPMLMQCAELSLRDDWTGLLKLYHKYIRAKLGHKGYEFKEATFKLHESHSSSKIIDVLYSIVLGPGDDEDTEIKRVQSYLSWLEAQN